MSQGQRILESRVASNVNSSPGGKSNAIERTSMNCESETTVNRGGYYNRRSRHRSRNSYSYRGNRRGNQNNASSSSRGSSYGYQNRASSSYRGSSSSLRSAFERRGQNFPKPNSLDIWGELRIVPNPKVTSHGALGWSHQGELHFTKPLKKPQLTVCLVALPLIGQPTPKKYQTVLFFIF